MTRVSVRPASPDDAPAVGLAHVRGWQAAYPGLVPQDYLDALDVDERSERWRKRFEDPDDHLPVLVAVVDGVVVGWVSFGPARDEQTGDGGEVYGIYVHPDHWGTGAGYVLLTAAHVALAEMGFDHAALWVLPGNAQARSFYERQGWSADEITREHELNGELTVPEIRYTKRLSKGL